MEKTNQQMHRKEKIITAVINILFLVLSTTTLIAIFSLVSSL